MIEVNNLTDNDRANILLHAKVRLEVQKRAVGSVEGHRDYIPENASDADKKTHAESIIKTYAENNTAEDLARLPERIAFQQKLLARGGPYMSL